MTQTQTKDVSQSPFPFSSIESLSVIIKEQTTGTTRNKDAVMELPVNNYLKTPEEIDMEFRYGVNPRKLNLRKEHLQEILSTNTMDGYFDIHNLDEALSGFMEENY